MPLHKVFIYGTLKTGHSHHADLVQSEGSARLLGLAETTEPFLLVVGTSLNVPLLLNSRGRGRIVVGELYEVDAAKLSKLDRIENHPHFYERKLEKVRLTHTDEVMDAWIYSLPRWAHDFLDKCSIALPVYHENCKVHGRKLMNGRTRESLTRDEKRQFFMEVLGFVPNIPTIHRVFFYGLHKKGEANHADLTEGEGWYQACGEAHTVERFPLVVGTSLNIPIVLAKRGDGKQIHGEIYEIDDAKLAILDRLESHPLMYERKLEKFISKESGATTEAWIYMVHQWSNEFLASCSKLLSSYTSNGAHGRIYSQRSEELTIKEEIQLFKEIMGFAPQ